MEIDFFHLLLQRDLRVAMVRVVVKFIISIRSCELLYRVKNDQFF